MWNLCQIENHFFLARPLIAQRYGQAGHHWGHCAWGILQTQKSTQQKKKIKVSVCSCACDGGSELPWLMTFGSKWRRRSAPNEASQPPPPLTPFNPDTGTQARAVNTFTHRQPMFFTLYSLLLLWLLLRGDLRGWNWTSLGRWLVFLWVFCFCFLVFLFCMFLLLFFFFCCSCC